MLNTNSNVLAESSFSKYMNNNPTSYEEALDYFHNQDFDIGKGPKPSFWGKTYNVLGDKNFMSGLAGVGQLGLGLAQYLTMKPLYEEQLKGLKQNRQFAAEDQARRNRTATNFERALG